MSEPEDDGIPVSDFRNVTAGPPIMTTLMQGRLVTGTVKKGVFVPLQEADRKELRELTEQSAREDLSRVARG